MLPPPYPNVCAGQIDAGDVWYDGPRGRLGLQPAEMNKHVGIVGASGSGKTTLALHLIKSMLENGVPVVCFDVNRTWRSLANIVPKEDVRIYTLARPDVSPFRMNFLREPDGVDPLLFDQITTSIADETLYGGLGSHSVSKMMTARLRSSGLEFTMLDMYRETNSMAREMGSRKRAGDWFSTAQRILGELCSPPLGYVVNWAGAEFESELESAKLVIFDCDLITHYQFTYFVTSFLAREYLKRLSTTKRDKINKLIVFEEAGRIFNQPFPQPTFETVLRECREVGLGILWINQSASDVNRTAWANTNTLFIFRQISSLDINAVAAAVSFEQAREKQYVARLPVGQCIVRLPDRYPFPFLLQTEDVAKAIVTDEEIHELAVARLAEAGIPFARKAEVEALEIIGDKREEKEKLLEVRRPAGLAGSRGSHNGSHEGPPGSRDLHDRYGSRGGTGGLAHSGAQGAPAGNNDKNAPVFVPSTDSTFINSPRIIDKKTSLPADHGQLVSMAHLLNEAIQRPGKQVTFLYLHAGMPKSTGSRVSQALQQAGFARASRTARDGRAITILEVTNAGDEWLRENSGLLSLDVPKNETRRFGGEKSRHLEQAFEKYAGRVLKPVRIEKEADDGQGGKHDYLLTMPTGEQLVCEMISGESKISEPLHAIRALKAGRASELG